MTIDLGAEEISLVRTALVMEAARYTNNLDWLERDAEKTASAEMIAYCKQCRERAARLMAIADRMSAKEQGHE
jgi:hypothetical protein